MTLVIDKSFRLRNCEDEMTIYEEALERAKKKLQGLSLRVAEIERQIKSLPDERTAVLEERGLVSNLIAELGKAVERERREGKIETTTPVCVCGHSYDYHFHGHHGDSKCNVHDCRCSDFKEKVLTQTGRVA